MKSMISVMQIILMVAGAVSIAMAVNGVPAIWSSILPWLRPPYLHVVINGIIIAIAAASRFRRSHAAPPARSQYLISVRTPPPAYYAAYTPSPAAYDAEDRVVELKPVVVNGLKVDERDVDEDDGENALVDRSLMYETAPPEIISPEFRLEYFAPANSIEDNSRGSSNIEIRQGGAPRPTPDTFRKNTRKSKSFGERTIYMDSRPSHAIQKNASLSRNKSNQRVEFQAVNPTVKHSSLLPEKHSPEFLTNYIPPENPYENIYDTEDREVEEEHETMESTWKKITSRADQERTDSDNSQPSLRIGKELSPNADELKRRVEAFIKKVNDEIRLCRQNSLDQCIQLNSAA